MVERLGGIVAVVFGLWTSCTVLILVGMCVQCYECYVCMSMTFAEFKR